MPATFPARPKGVAPEKKWDWELIQALYLGGMELSEIIKIPRFKDLSPNYLAKRASTQRWKQRREQAQAEGASAIALPLIDRMNTAVHIHQNWLLTQLAAERKVFEGRLKAGKDQGERLESLRRIDELTRKLLGMDDMKPVSPQQRNLGVIIAMQGTNARVSIDKDGGINVTADEEVKEKPLAARDMAAEVERMIHVAKVGQELEKRDAMEEARETLGPPPGVRPIAAPTFKMTDEESLVDENNTEPTEETEPCLPQPQADQSTE